MTIGKDHERIWLQSYADTEALGSDRLWCEDKVWPNDPEDHEPTEYVRADLFAALEAERDELRRVIAWANNSLYGSHGFFLSKNGGEPDEHHLDRAIEDLKERNRKLYAELSTARRTALLEGRRQAFDEVGQKAREYAALYPEASDGRNTFIIFAEWAEGKP